MNKHQINALYFLLALVGLLAIQSYWQSAQHTKEVPYSEFLTDLKSGQIRDVVIKGKIVTGELKTSTDSAPQHVVSNLVDPTLTEQLSKYDVKFSAVEENTWFATLVSWIAPAVIFVAVWLFVIRRVADKQGFGSGLMSVGKSKAKIYVEKDIKTTFADVAGVDEAKEELREIVQFLKDPDGYGRLGARMPKGVLLVGPPGTGKTLLARAVAGEAGVPFFSISGSEFVEMFVGVGAARVRDLFEEARKHTPAIIFIDELDALGRARGIAPLGGGHDEKEQTLNQLLAEMDGFDPRHGLMLLAATNRPEVLDPALLRAGRFDRQILVDRPDKAGRLAILKIHVHHVSLDAALNLEQVAAMTAGFSGADIENLVNEAAIVATRRSGNAVTTADFTRAIERIVAGLEKKSRLMNAQERKTVAYHELGHAFVALSLDKLQSVQKVSIIPRGIGALGYTIQQPLEDRYLMTSQELCDRMAVLLGGRVSEALIFKEISTGAADDLAKASDIAKNMATRYGMVAELGNVIYEEPTSQFLGDGIVGASGVKRYSELTAQQIDVAVRKLMAEAYKRAEELLRSKREALDRAAAALLDRETLEREELLALFSGPTSASVPMLQGGGTKTREVGAA